MTKFIVTYDLVKEKDYQTLWAELAKLGAHRALESFWLINVSNTARELHNHFKNFIDSDDVIWVSELTHEFDFSNVTEGTNDWIKKN